MSWSVKLAYYYHRARSRFLSPERVRAGAPLYLCTVFKNEAPYLREWLYFHLERGVSHFLLIDNFSDDNPRQVLRPFQDAGQVTLLKTETKKMSAAIQARELNRGIRHLRESGRAEGWCAFIDVDEFLFATGKHSLQQVIESFSNKPTGAVLANWLMFGTSKLEELDPDRSLISQLIYRAPDRMNEHRLFKPICWLPNVVAFVGGPHLPVLRHSAPAYYSNGEVYQTGKTRFIHEPLRINHYWYRSEKYYREEKVPKRLAFAPPRETEIARSHYEACNKVEDRSILNLH